MNPSDENPQLPPGPALPRAAALIYAVLAVLPASVLLLNPHQVPNFFPNPDALPTLWNFWWFDRAAAAGRNPWVTDLLFYPHGTSLFLHTFEVIDAVLTAPVRWLAGVEMAWKAAFVLQGFLSLVGAHLLARRLGTGNIGAGMAAVVLTLGSYRFVNSPALSVLSTGYAFLLAWAVIGCWQEPTRKRHGAWLGVFSVLLLLTNLYYLLFVTIILGAAGLVLAIRARPEASIWKGWGVQLAIAAAIGIVPLALIGNGIRRASSEGGSVTNFEEWNQVRGSADLAQLLLPLKFRSIVEHSEVPDWPWGLGSVPQRSFSFAPPLVVLLIALLGFLGGKQTAGLRREVRWGLAVAAAVGFFLALGPEVKIWTTRDPADVPAAENTGKPAHWEGYAIPSPYRLIANAPIFSQIRCNCRAGYFFQAALLIILAPLFEAGIARMLTREQLPRPAVAWAIALGLMWWEFPIHFLQCSPSLPAEPLEAIRDAPGPGAVQTYPESTYVMQGIAMRDQILHKRPIFGGYISRLPADYLDWLSRRPWAEHLHGLAAGRAPDLTAGQSETFRRSAAADGLRFLVVYKIAIPSDDPEGFLQYFPRNHLGRVLVNTPELASVELAPPTGS